MKENSARQTDAVFWLSVAVLIAGFCIQYFVAFGELLHHWNKEDFSYCYVVPFLFGYLVYTNREALKKVEVRPSSLGFVGVFLAGLLFLAGRLGSMETLVYLSIWVAIVGAGFLLVGVRVMKALAFPLVILAFIVPLPPFLNNLLTFKLKLMSSVLSVEIMQLGGLSVFREGNVIDLGVTQLQVVDACSGLRYVYPLFLMGLVFAYLFHKKWWERGAIILATVPISVISNALRIAITGYLTAKVSGEAAEGFFHGFSGWLIFMVSFVFLAILSWGIKRISARRRDNPPVGAGGGNPGSKAFDWGRARASYLWVASALFLLFWGLNAALVSAQVAPERKSFEAFPTEIGPWQGTKSYLSEDILKQLWADDYVQLEFRNTETGHIMLLFVPYYESQTTRHTAHSPVSCLVGSGFAPRSRTVIKRDFPGYGRVDIRQMVLEKDRQSVLSNYWFQQRGRVIVSEYANKWYLFRDSVTRKRTDGALVRMEMPLAPGLSVESAQELMDEFTAQLMEILPEYVPN